MNPLWHRAFLLYQQDRHDMAEESCRQYLLESPDDANGLWLLALVLHEQSKHDEALETARRAIVAAPDHPQTHLVHAVVLFGRERIDEAGRAVGESLALDPDQPQAWGLLALIYFRQDRWQQALDAAERGLQGDPENARCLNIKAMSLNRLGRAGMADATLRDALSRNPDNGLTHANLGWTKIEQGDYRGALDSFREALRIDPELDYAREGVVEAIKGKNLLYRGMLRYTLWLRRMTSQQRWMMMIGGYLGFRAVRQIGALVPALAPFTLPLVIAYTAFALFTWISDPLANLLLRLHPDGKYALSSRQVTEANWGGALIGAAIALVVAAFAIPRITLLLAAPLMVLLVPAVSGLIHCEPGPPRRNMALVTTGVAVLTAWLVVDLASEGAAWKALHPSLAGVTLAAWQGYPWAVLGTQFAAAYFVSQRVAR
ncbi:MAG TPA: tetratricopeptide repeat protein [Pirellulaceae bacterium]|nr:tetratricopeptide repeat protein [Pirellulaceae bacterium]